MKAAFYPLAFSSNQFEFIAKHQEKVEQRLDNIFAEKSEYGFRIDKFQVADNGIFIDCHVVDGDCNIIDQCTEELPVKAYREFADMEVPEKFLRYL
jgi:hypothetical protein